MKRLAAGQAYDGFGSSCQLHLAAATAASGDRELAVVALPENTPVDEHESSLHLLAARLCRQKTMDAYWKMAAEGIHSGSEEKRDKYCQVLDMLHATLPDPCDTTIVWPAIWMGYSSMVFKTLGTQITPPNMVGLMSLWADIEPIRQTRLHPRIYGFCEENWFGRCVGKIWLARS